MARVGFFGDITDELPEDDFARLQKVFNVLLDENQGHINFWLARVNEAGTITGLSKYNNGVIEDFNLDYSKLINAPAGSAGTSNNVYAQATPPAGANGDFWLDTDASPLVLYIWTGGAWMEAATKDATWENIVNLPSSIQQTFFQDAEPSSGMSSGDYWIDTDDDNKLYRYNGSTWNLVADQRIGQALTDAATAQATADGKIVTFIQTTPPGTAAVGDLWFDADADFKPHRYSGTQWDPVAYDVADWEKIVGDAKASDYATQNNVFRQEAEPTGQDGDFWYQPSTRNLKRHNGTLWDLVGTTGATWGGDIDGQPDEYLLNNHERYPAAGVTVTMANGHLHQPIWVNHDIADLPDAYSAYQVAQFSVGDGQAIEFSGLALEGGSDGRISKQARIHLVVESDGTATPVVAHFKYSGDLSQNPEGQVLLTYQYNGFPLYDLTVRVWAVFGYSFITPQPGMRSLWLDGTWHGNGSGNITPYQESSARADGPTISSFLLSQTTVAQTANYALGATVGATWGSDISGQPVDADLLNALQEWAEINGSTKPSDYATVGAARTGSLFIDEHFGLAHIPGIWQFIQSTPFTLEVAAGEQGDAAWKLDATNAPSTFRTMHGGLSYAFPVEPGETLWFTARIWIDSALDGKIGLGLRMQEDDNITLSKVGPWTGGYAIDTTIATVVPERDQWATYTFAFVMNDDARFAEPFWSIRDDATAGYVLIDNVRVSRVQPNATVGATWDNDITGQPGDDVIYNDRVLSPLDTGNWDFSAINEDGRPFGWYRMDTGEPIASLITYSDVPNRIVKVESASDDQIGISSALFPVEENNIYEFDLLIACGTADSANGLYVRASTIDEAQEGITHLSRLPTQSASEYDTSQALQPDVQMATLSTTPVENDELLVAGKWYTYAFRPNPGQKLASLHVLNWSGNGTKPLFIKRIVTRVRPVSSLGINTYDESGNLLDLSRLDNQRTLPESAVAITHLLGKPVPMTVYFNNQQATGGYWADLFAVTLDYANAPLSFDGLIRWGGSNGRFRYQARVNIEVESDGAGGVTGNTRFAYSGDDPTNIIKVSHVANASNVDVKVRLYLFAWSSIAMSGEWYSNSSGAVITPYRADMLTGSGITQVDPTTGETLLSPVANYEIYATVGATFDVDINGQITGTNVGTYVANGAIKDEQVNTLSANKLTAGTIDASVITVLNLDAGNINTGSLDAAVASVINLNASNINAGTLSAARIALNSLQLEDDGSGNLRIKAGGVGNSQIASGLSADKITTGTLAADRLVLDGQTIIVDTGSGALKVGNIPDSQVVTSTVEGSHTVPTNKSEFTGANITSGNAYNLGTVDLPSPISAGGKVTITYPKVQYYVEGDGTTGTLIAELYDDVTLLDSYTWHASKTITNPFGMVAEEKAITFSDIAVDTRDGNLLQVRLRCSVSSSIALYDEPGLGTWGPEATIKSLGGSFTAVVTEAATTTEGITLVDN